MTDPAPPIRLLLVDDHPLVRDGLRVRLSATPGLQVVAEAGDAAEALEAVALTTVDLVVMDVSLRGGATGIEATASLRERHPGLKVLMLSMHDKPEYVRAARAAGASGYVLKDGPAELIIDAIAQVMSGAAFVAAGLELPPQTERGSRHLTLREQEVLALVAEGLSSRHIGERLGMGVRTVETHRTNLRRKLDLASPAALVRYAIERMRGR